MLLHYSKKCAANAKRSIHIATNAHSLWGWGLRSSLPPVRENAQSIVRPIQISGLTPEHDGRIASLAAGWGHSLIATRDGNRSTVHSYGLNRSGQLGIGKQSLDNFDQGVAMVSDDQIKFLAAGREHSHIVSQDEKGHTKLFSFGNNMYGQLGVGKSKHDSPSAEQVLETTPNLVDGIDGNITHIACGLDNTVFSTDRNHVYSMGWGPDGQLGLGRDSSGDRSSPTLIPLMEGKRVAKLAGSTDFSLVLTEEGNLWTWGNSEYGQGMLSRKIDRILEPLETNISEVIDIAAGGPFSIILKENGQVYSCGYGALGLGQDTIETLDPKPVKIEEKVTKIFATQDMAAAISVSGQLYTWGLGGHSGRLGLGHSEHAFVPQKVHFDDPTRKVLDLALGTSHAICICT
ncbi:regulator of chromosome condensation 1/beta-lactamase-inhibitor protein II [Umbelopsis sp. PMI_123]|nr:regulator of chromosome condensation 1/beta-lactamase-inhibitor protein II [Umbelopsis sp. PMI_123]